MGTRPKTRAVFSLTVLLPEKSGLINEVKIFRHGKPA